MKSLITLTLLSLCVSLFSQETPTNDAVIAFTGNGGISIKNIKNKKVSTEGSHYYNDTWYVGTVTLFSGEVIENYPLKYDMKMNQIDIKVDGEIRALSIGKVKEVVWYKSNGIIELLRNSIVYDKNKLGMFSVNNDGKTPLLKMTTVKLQEPNYNPAMDVGSRANKYTKSISYYTTTNTELKKIKNNKRKVLKVFKDKAETVKEYASENSLSFKNDYDLAKIFDYYNSL